MNGLFSLLAIAAGCAFIILGRWTYHNPRKVFPNAFYSNPGSPLLVTPVRIFSVLLIFVGSYGILAFPAGLLLHGYTVLFVATPAAIAATWLLWPKPTGETATSAGLRESVPNPVTGFLTRQGKWILGISLIIATALAIMVVVHVLRIR